MVRLDLLIPLRRRALADDDVARAQSRRTVDVLSRALELGNARARAVEKGAATSATAPRDRTAARRDTAGASTRTSSSRVARVVDRVLLIALVGVARASARVGAGENGAHVERRGMTRARPARHTSTPRERRNREATRTRDARETESRASVHAARDGIARANDARGRSIGERRGVTPVRGRRHQIGDVSAMTVNDTAIANATVVRELLDEVDTFLDWERDPLRYLFATVCRCRRSCGLGSPG